MDSREAISHFYLKHFNQKFQETLVVTCPFCEERGFAIGRMTVILNPDSFFYGYFRCNNRCVSGGFPLWFAQLASIDPSIVPGYDPDLDDGEVGFEYPIENINDEITTYKDRITESIYDYFQKGNVSKQVLQEMQVGFNGRYLVYPYFQEDGNCYAARCVYPEKVDDYFWSGNSAFTKEPFTIFNVQDLLHAQNGALFLCAGEDNLLTVKQLGFPAIAVPHFSHLEQMSEERFKNINTVFISVSNSSEALSSARNFASKVGHKARILPWSQNSPNRFSLFQLAKISGKDLGQKIAEMVKRSRAFSPFSSPLREYQLFCENVKKQTSSEYQNLKSGFTRLDAAIGGVHGINVIGGAPKVGKSTFMIQLASEMARKKIPVLYYDFENGRQKIYQRTLSRLARVATRGFTDKASQTTLQSAKRELQKMMYFWRVINDRKVNPELMRKHIDFIRHETRSEYTVVVIDSLHKLPFKDFSERRTGIDAWLRQMESIRDQMQVSFLVISELSRGSGATVAYEEEPHLGVFKGSGDIEYSADNAMVLYPTHGVSREGESEGVLKSNTLWLVASREHPPGKVAEYRVDYPYWGVTEHDAQ